MKRLGFFMFLALCVACGAQKHVSKDKAGRLCVKDSTKYELIVFDTGFDYWLAVNKNRIGEYSNEYYRMANNQYAMEWNRRYAQGDKRVNSYIDYYLQNEYDFDFNYRLYMYFKYWEEKNRTKLVPGY